MGQRLIFSQIACSASAAASNASSPERYTRLWVSSSSCSAESPLKSNRCGSIVSIYGLPVSASAARICGTEPSPSPAGTTEPSANSASLTCM